MAPRLPNGEWRNWRTCSYRTLRLVYGYMSEHAEPMYYYARTTRTFIPSGVSVFVGRVTHITNELGLNRRYGTDAIRELAKVGCLRQLRAPTPGANPGKWELRRPPTRVDWFSLRDDLFILVWSQRVMRRAVMAQTFRLAEEQARIMREGAKTRQPSEQKG